MPARGGAAAWADHLQWVMLGIRASPKEESGTSAGEAALGRVLAVPGQLLTTTAPPANTPAPPAVIPAAKRTYAEAAAIPALDGATHVYKWRGGAAAGGQLCGPLPGAGEGAQGFQAAAGDATGGGELGPAEASRGDGTAGSGGAATQGAPSPERRVEDLPQDFRRSAGSSVTALKSL